MTTHVLEARNESLQRSSLIVEASMKARHSLEGNVAS